VLTGNWVTKCRHGCAEATTRRTIEYTSDWCLASLSGVKPPLSAGWRSVSGQR
jgi:hypothetical protein